MVLKVSYLLVELCRLTELKAESRRRREQREIDAMMLVNETKRRREIIERQFYEWNDGRKVDCGLIVAALQTYASMYNATLLFNRPLDVTDKDLHRSFYLADYMTVCLLLLETVAAFKLHWIHKMWTIAVDNPGVCQSACLSCQWTVQKRWYGSTSCLCWRLLGTQGSLY